MRLYSLISLPLRGAFLITAVTLAISIQAPAATAQVLAGTVTLPAGTQPKAIAVNPATGKVYTANSGNATISVIDGQTPLAPPATITLPAGSSPASLAVNPATNTIYAGNTNGTISVINGGTNASTSLSVASATMGLAVNASTNTLYAASTDGTVTSINGGTNVTTKLMPASSNAPLGIAINSVTNRIYIANSATGTVTAINGSTGAVAATITVGATPIALLANPITNKIYVVNFGSNNVSVIDGASNTVTATLSVGTQPNALALNAVTNQVYVANSGSSSVSDIDGASNHVSSITVGTDPVAISVDAGLNTIYVADSGSGDVAAIAGATNTVTRITAGQAPVAVAVNPITHDAFVTNTSSASHSVTLITSSGATITTLPNTAPSSLSPALLNPATQQYFIQSYGSGIAAVTILSALTNTVQATVPLLYGGNNYSNYYLGGPMDLNPLTDKLYVANEGFTSGDVNSNVTVIDGQTFTSTSVAVGNEPHIVVVNPVTNKVYMTSPQSGTMTVIDGTTNIPKTVYTTSNQSFSEPWSLAINTNTNTIYVGNQQTEDISVFNGDADFITGSIPTTSYSDQLLVDPRTNRLYSLNEYVLQVIDGNTNTTVSSLTPCYLPRSMALNSTLNKLYVTNCEDYSYSVVNTSTFTFTNYPGTSGVFDYAIAPNPATGQAYLATTLAYESTAADSNILVLDGGTDAVTQIPAAAQFTSPIVNPKDGSVYLSILEVDNPGDPLTGGSIILTRPASVPLLPTITPVTDSKTIANSLIFETGNKTPSFTATTTGGYPALPAYVGLTAANPTASELYYSIDGGEAWSLATPTPSGFSIQPSTALTYGQHTLYAYAAYGTEGGSSSSGQNALAGNTPELGDIVGYSFYVIPVLPATTTTLTPSPNPQTYNNPVNLTVQVSSTTPGTFGGQFVIFDGNTLLQYGLTPDSTGKATYTSPILALTTGAHTLTATYYSDPNYASSTSAPFIETINSALPATTLTLSGSPNPQAVGGSVTLTATVTSTGGSGAFTGKVSIADSGTLIASNLAPSATGVATYTTSTLAIGAHTLVATYTGDPNYANSTSLTFTETINAAPTFILTGNPATLTVSAGSSGSTTLTVTPANGFTGTVSLTCTGAPANSTCAIAPTPVSINSTAAATATLTLTAHSLVAENHPLFPTAMRVDYALTLLPFAGLLALIRRRKDRLSLHHLAVVLLVITPLLAIAGCGSGGGGGSTSQPINTTPGGYTLQVTAASGTTSATMNLPLTIQ